MGNIGYNSDDLVSREERLAKFCLDNAPVCALRLDQDGNILYANRIACESLDHTQAELLKMSVFDIDPHVDRRMWPRAWKRICDEGFVTFESEHRRKDGAIFPIEVTATLIEFEGRRYALALIKNIRERKRISESLRLSRFMFDRASFGIFITKDGGYISDVNAYACKYLGYRKEELCRMNILDIDPMHSAGELDELWRRLREEGIDTFETVHRRKDGSDVPVAITGNLLEFNEEMYSVSFVQDITEIKNGEKQRRKMEAKMRETQKMESLGTLAGGIAHDFNNILSAINGYAELAQMEAPADGALKQYVDQISQAGRRARSLVQQILTFSRQGRSEKKPIDISRAVTEALRLMRATLPKEIEMRENIPSNLGPVIADETQIHQIVMNLCTNASHAMKITGGAIDVRLATVVISPQDAQNFQGMAPGNYLNITVADTGSGIAPELLDRIFDPYFSTKPIGEGTGLGLSTVHGIVKDHGGTIKVYSEVGAGTMFHVFLPIAVASTSVAVEPSACMPTGDENILFVDDEKPLIDLGRDLLERMGYRVETRASAIDAIEAFRSDPYKYDLIISDISMPKMTGYELARRVKAIRPDIPMILSSGFSERTDAAAMKEIGVSAILMKPVTNVDLAQTVRRALDNK